MNEHLVKLQNNLPANCDAALIESPLNRRYYTGMASTAGTLFVTKTNACLIIDFRYIEKAKATAKDCDVILQENLTAQLKDLCQKYNVKTVAIESEQTTVARLAALKKDFSGIEFVTDGLDAVINAQRVIKTPAELDIMRSAQAITDKAFLEILNFIKKGRTEREVRNELEYLMRKFGGDGLAFETIAVSGKNSSMPHGKPTDKPLCDGDFFTIDFGAMKDGYCSDMTRTVAIGNISDKQRMVYDIVLEAQRRALAVIKAGVICKDVDFAARDYIERENGFKGCFEHGLGHSLGLEVHEDPRFNKITDLPAQAGSVMSVEPGIYLEGEFGVRIEDIVVIRENGYENLTASPKELIIL